MNERQMRRRKDPPTAMPTMAPVESGEELAGAAAAAAEDEEEEEEEEELELEVGDEVGGVSVEVGEADVLSVLLEEEVCGEKGGLARKMGRKGGKYVRKESWLVRQ